MLPYTRLFVAPLSEDCYCTYQFALVPGARRYLHKHVLGASEHTCSQRCNEEGGWRVYMEGFALLLPL
jgi:hypothetical protein